MSFPLNDYIVYLPVPTAEPEAPVITVGPYDMSLGGPSNLSSAQHCQRILRLLPMAMNSGFYIAIVINAVSGVIYTAIGDQESADRCFYGSMIPLQHTLAVTASSALVTGLKAVKELCQNGCAAARETLTQSFKAKGLIRDTIFPTPKRVLQISRNRA